MTNADGIFDTLRHPEIRRQIARARAEYGPEFDPAPLTLLLLLHRLAATLRSAETFELEAIGLTQTGFNVLMALHRSPAPMAMGEIATAISVQPPNLTAAVRELEKKKLIRRRHDVTDRRSQLVETSARGESLLTPFLDRHFEFLGTLFDSVGAAERVELIGLLDRILAAVTAGDGDHGLADRVAAAAAHSQ